MNNDESFERELRATLGELARRPAPEQLVARVSRIPSLEPAPRSAAVRRGLSSRGIGSGFALLAAGVVVAVLAILAHPGSGPTPVGGSPSSAIGTPGSPAPTSASAAPSSTPSSSPAAQGTPSSSPSGSAVPAGFEPLSATFVSASEGWVLGSVPCGAASCPAIVRTTDGGVSWSAIGAPATTVGGRPAGAPGGQAGISGLRFADPLDGWAFGPELWATHDGGTTWVKTAIVGLPAGATVTGLEASAGIVHAVLYDGAQDFRIASTPVAKDAWNLASVLIPVGAGPVPAVQLVLSGSAGWVLENDRVVTAGARLEAGTWRTWKPACLDVVGPAVLGASSASDLVAACDVGQWSTPQGDHLFTSHDGGTTFVETGPRTPLSGASAVASPGRATIVIAGTDASGSVLVGSFDGGLTWSTVLRPGAGPFTDLGFTTATQGIVITTSGTTSQLRMTRDGGRTWSAVTF
ncbi:MAG: sialidase family protein [Candidatus Limnocylindrales bacterium]